MVVRPAPAAPAFTKSGKPRLDIESYMTADLVPGRRRYPNSDQ